MTEQPMTEQSKVRCGENSGYVPAVMIFTLAARVAGWAALAVIAVLSVVPGHLRPHVLGSNKLEHFCAYLLATLLLLVGHSGRRALLYIAMSLPIYAGALEIAQLWIPGRGARLADFASSSFGAWVAIAAVSVARCWYSTSSRRNR